MVLSSSSCCRSASSDSSSSSSTALAVEPWVRALAISLLMACCSSRSSIVASTLSMVRPPWIVFMALEALPRASRVSLLMLAVSMLAIWPSRFMICADVCSSVVSSCFFFRKALLAAAKQIRHTGACEAISRERTRLVGVDELSGLLVLLIHLVLQVFLALIEHLEGAPQLQDRLLGCIFLCCRASAKPTAQPPARHV